jgi:sulfur carrier protein
VPRLRDNADMEIFLNGERLSLAEHCSILDLLREHGLSDRRVAVEVNGTIVSRGLHASHVLRPDDRIEIVHALGGG